MRKIFFSLFLLFATAQFVTAQVVNVPDAAKKHFAEKYPKAQDPKWTNNVTNYTAEFKQKDVPVKVSYNVDGSWNYTEAFIPDSKVPKSVKESFQKSKYHDWKVKSIVAVETSKGENSFRVEATKGIEKKYIFYDKNGVTLHENMGI
jgi:hypothetical protein